VSTPQKKNKQNKTDGVSRRGERGGVLSEKRHFATKIRIGGGRGRRGVGLVHLSISKTKKREIGEKKGEGEKKGGEC